MNKRFTKLIAALALLVFTMPSLVAWGQTRAEVVAYTLDGTQTGGSSGYDTESDITQNDISWKVMGNTTMNPWRIGGKSLTNIERPVYSTAAISDNITKIEVTHGTAASITVNSWTVIVASDASFTNVVSTLTPTFTASSTTTINRPDGVDWTDCYYKFIYNVTVSATSNKFLQFTKAEFYKQEGSGPVIATPTFSPASGAYAGTQSVTISCETEGTTIYYTTDGTTPDDESTEYTAPITVDQTMTIKAIAYDGEDNTSSVATANYTILEHAGTETDPYSVADARAAIDANTGITNVYATGIISQVDEYNSNYSSITYWISADGTTTSDQLEVYSGKGLNNTNFSSINDIEVGATVVIYGTLKKYNNIYEFDKNNYLVEYTAPSHAVEAPTFSPAAGTYAEAQTVTISCETPDVDIYYTLDGTDPNMESAMYENPITVSTTTTIKAVAYNGDDVASNITTATYHINSQANPYTVTQALAFLEYPANNIYVEGIVSTAPTEAPTSNGQLTYYISVDGEATNQLEVYKGLGLDQAQFTTQDDIQVGDIVTIFGNVKIYNNAKEFDQGNYLVAFERPVVPVIDATAGEALAYDATEGSIVYEISNYVEGTMTATTTAEWISNLVVDEQNEMGEVTFDVTTNNTGEVRTGTVTLTFTYDTDKTVTADVTVSQAALVVPVINAEDVNIAFTATSGSIAYTIQNGEGMVTAVITEGDWLTLGEITATEVPFTCSANEGEARTATVTLSFEGAGDKVVTVTQAAYAEIYTGEGTFNKVTALTDLEDGGYYVIYSTKAMNSILTNGAMGATAVTPVNNVITNPAVSIVWKLEAAGDNWNLYSEDIAKYCYISGNNTTSFATGTTSEYSYTVTVNSNGGFTFASTHTNGRCISLSSDGNSFRSFAASNNPTVELYKLGEASTDPFISIANPTIEVAFEGGNGTVEVTYGNITDIDASVYFCDADGVEASYDWMTASINTDNNIAYTVNANEGDARTAYLKVKVGETYSNLVTINQAAYVAPFEPVTYTLATSIISGRHYIISNGTNKAMGAQGGNNRSAVDVEIEGDVATVSSANVYEFVINGPDANGYYTIYDEEYEYNNNIGGYLYAASGSSNYLKTETHLDDGNNGLWTITFDADENNAVITAQGTNSRNLMRYNSSNYIFSCYASGQQNIYLYVKDNETECTFVKDIAAYQGDGGYYLIASPVAMNIADVEGMTTGTFDLYTYDDSQDLEWINYKPESGVAPFTTLEPGTGYLYANSANVTLTFAGTPAGNGQIPVIAGWNLVGNPFGVAATPNMPYYRLDSERGALNAETESGAVSAMEGVFVNATEAGNVTFSTSGNSKGQNIALNLSRNERSASVIDRAIVRFDEGQQLPKFQLNPENTKLYIAQGNKDYAIVRSAAQGEMPVSFRASANGTYTLAVETENVEMDYLHLIDNMTGADVDLLQTPSYTFEARTSDYASRFRLVFSANETDGPSTGSGAFAYFNGSEWQISNVGEATLQVVDVMGRTLSSQTISGNANVSINQPAGIYMLRLVNGNDVKVQKVVVR